MDIWPQEAWGSRGCESLARLFGDLSHPLRLGVVRHLLAHGEECVCSLARRCGVDQPTLSRHLRILKDHAVLVDRREGSNVFYRVTDPRVAPLLDALGVLEVRKRPTLQIEEES
ncbi:MAG: ArsR/SmtB family transcription factor [Halothiobacillaceae bacterium]